MAESTDKGLTRRDFVHGAVSSAAIAAVPATVFAASGRKEADKAAVVAQIPAMHAENLKRL